LVVKGKRVIIIYKSMARLKKHNLLGRSY